MCRLHARIWHVYDLPSPQNINRHAGLAARWRHKVMPPLLFRTSSRMLVSDDLGVLLILVWIRPAQSIHFPVLAIDVVLFT